MENLASIAKKRLIQRSHEAKQRDQYQRSQKRLQQAPGTASNNQFRFRSSNCVMDGAATVHSLSTPREQTSPGRVGGLSLLNQQYHQAGITRNNN